MIWTKRKNSILKQAHLAGKTRGLKLNTYEEILFLIDAFRPKSSEDFSEGWQNKPLPESRVTAPKLLTNAANIMEERGKTYDTPGGERSMGKAVDAFNTITGQDITEAEGWLLMQVLKDVRQWSSAPYHRDSAEDCIAYSALKAEALEAETLKLEAEAEAEAENIGDKI